MHRTLRDDVSRQELVDSIHQMIEVWVKTVTQIRLGIYAIEIAKTNWRIHGGTTLAAAVGASE